MNEFLLIIDGSSLLSTQFYGNLPKEVLTAKTVEEKEKYYHKIMKTSKGQYTNGIYGFLRTLFRIIEQQNPRYLAITWDLSRDTFRRELYSEYKENRGETIAPLSEQFATMQEILERMGIRLFRDIRYEADDFSGSLSKKFESEVPVCILTKDHDYLQLASEKTTIWMLHSAQSKADELFKKYKQKKDSRDCPEKVFPLTPQKIKSEYGIMPEEVAALKGLMGDSSDNIKGVPGIGPATAVALIAHYGSVEALYRAIDEDEKNGYSNVVRFWKEELGIKRNPLGYLNKEDDENLVGRKAAFLSERLATIKTDLPIPEELSDLEVRINAKETAKILRELEITSLRLPQGMDGETASEALWGTEKTTELTDDFSFADEILSGKFWSGNSLGIASGQDDNKTVWWITDGLCAYGIEISGFITEDFLSERFLALTEKGFSFAVCDWKESMAVVSVSPKKIFDVSLADYLLRPLSTEHGPDEIASVWYEYSGENLTGKSRASFCLAAKNLLAKELDKKNLTVLYQTIELPLVPVLFDMEKAGIRANYDELTAYGETMTAAILEEQKIIYRMSGEEFNINSPKQLGEVLFEKMKLPHGKKTKSGYSTASDILEKLEPDYDIVKHILHYRQLTKLKSTYVDGLKNYIEKDGRIHSKFNQMVTATGRLSSTEPNLQNIPIRFALGRELRKVFVPAEGCVFLDADYSQIELRLMAHMSGDESMQSAFRNNEDIHRATAGQVFGVPYEEVTSAQRSAAKAVNFGIIYGIGSFSLGQDLNIPKKQADAYIQSYFAKYPKVKQYLDHLVADAKEQKEARTLYGRLRPIPELASENFMQRAFGERVAMNMPIQGTAADIIKIAMIRVHSQLKENGLKSRLLLQVHDELLIETEESEISQVTELLRKAMVDAAKLSVDLEVDIHQGRNWFEAK